jgi:hypothetical protein
LQHNDGFHHFVLATYGPSKPAVYARPHLDRLREQCRRVLRESPPARVIAVGIRPPFDGLQGVDDPTWTELCKLLAELPTAKDYWSRVSAEHDAMARFGFVARDGWFDALVESLESERE